MKIFDVLVKNIDGSLSIAEAVDILADQAKVPDISHVHMHMRDGFAVYVKPTFQLNDDQSRNHYEEAHMTTPQRATAQGAVPVWDGNGKPPGDRFHQDPSRMASPATPGGNRSKYDMRSNQKEIPEVPAITKLRPTVSRYDQASKSTVRADAPGAKVIKITGDVGDALQTGRNHPDGVSSVPMKSAVNSDWRRDKTTGGAAVTYVQQVVRTKVPKIPGSEKHTMFEDSESMAMYLCAALRSTAGFRALKLLNDKPLGDVTTVAVFSKTAVHQVKEHIAAVNKKQKTHHASPKAVERVTQMQPGVQRTATNPNPVADTFSHNKKNIDHIVLVLGKRADESLNVVTFYPSPDTTSATINADNTGNIDLVEAVFGGPKDAVPMDQAAMDLRW